jgi:hypothetical protein
MSQKETSPDNTFEEFVITPELLERIATAEWSEEALNRLLADLITLEVVCSN